MFEKGHPLYLHPRDCHAPRARRQPRLQIHLVKQLDAAELKKILRDGNYRQRTLSYQDRREVERILLAKVEPLHAVFFDRGEKLLWSHLVRECVSLVGTEWRVGMPFRVEALPRAWKPFLQKKPALQAEDIVRFFELLLEVGLIIPLGIPGMNGLQTCRFSTDPHKIIVELVPGSQRTPMQVSPEWYALSRDILRIPPNHWLYGRQKALLSYLRTRFSLRESPQTILKRLGPISRKASGCLGLVVQYANGNLIPCWPGLTAMRPQVAPLLSCVLQPSWTPRRLFCFYGRPVFLYHAWYMQQSSSAFQRVNNPFSVRDASLHESAEQQYEQLVQGFARRFIYAEAVLNEKEIEREISAALRIPRLRPLEKEHHQLEGLQELLKGIEAHERANLIQTGPWQAALLRQDSLERKKPPEKLTRREVANEFAQFRFADALVEAEKQTLQHYRQLLELQPEASIRLSQNIEIGRTDIEVLMIDIENRQAERLSDANTRQAKLHELDAKLAEIISRIPDDQWGKRFEIEEIYLLRRLIHAADTGHLASISHGTPRADLRSDLGSVDIELTAASDVLAFQLKTFKRGVHSGTRAKQAEVHARAAGRLEGSETHLVTLEAEEIQKTYEASLRQSAKSGTTRADKYAALEPITRDLRPDQRERLLVLIGLTEQDLAKEAEENEQRRQARLAFEEELRERRLSEQAREQRVIDERLALERAREAEEALKREQAEQERKRIEAEAHARLTAINEAKMRKQAEVAENLRQAQVREEERRQAAFLAEQAAAKKEAARLRRQIAEQERPDWPPKTMEKIMNAQLLKRMGLLAEDWTNQVPPFIAAKKRFFQLFAKPKKGASEATEKDKPSELFLQAFPDKQSLEAPTEADIARWRTLTK